jgi:hypothetical protein
MDLQSIGNGEGKRALERDLARKLLTLRGFCYSTFWEDILKNWVAVFADECTLAEAIEELLATTEDLIAAVARGECTQAALGFPTECVKDLVDAYGLDGPWKIDLDDLARRLDTIAMSPEKAAAIAGQAIPVLRSRLADERSRSE